MGEFTKGPWFVDQEDEKYITQVDASEDISIAHVLPVDAGGPKGFYYGDETVANARLIAAAPDLLEALDLCLAELEAEHMPTDEVATAIVKARAAIARARGEA